MGGEEKLTRKRQVMFLNLLQRMKHPSHRCSGENRRNLISLKYCAIVVVRKAITQIDAQMTRWMAVRIVDDKAIKLLIVGLRKNYTFYKTC